MKKPLVRAAIEFRSLASRLAGVSILGFGATFKAPEPERTVVRDVLTELEEKRALFSGAVWEEPAHVVASIQKIREILTNGLKRVGDNSPARDAFRIMRASRREFLKLHVSKSFENKPEMMRHHGRDGQIWEQEEFFIGLGKFRQIFGQQIATLGYLYRIDIEADMASILPPDALSMTSDSE